MKQEQTESADEYLNLFREAVKNCQHGDTADDIVRDRLVVTVRGMRLQRKYYECTTLILWRRRKTNYVQVRSLRDI
jgi:hypothetical protein